MKKPKRVFDGLISELLLDNLFQDTSNHPANLDWKKKKAQRRLAIRALKILGGAYVSCGDDGEALALDGVTCRELAALLLKARKESK